MLYGGGETRKKVSSSTPRSFHLSCLLSVNLNQHAVEEADCTFGHTSVCVAVLRARAQPQQFAMCRANPRAQGDGWCSIAPNSPERPMRC